MNREHGREKKKRGGKIWQKIGNGWKKKNKKKEFLEKGKSVLGISKNQLRGEI